MAVGSDQVGIDGMARLLVGSQYCSCVQPSCTNKSCQSRTCLIGYSTQRRSRKDGSRTQQDQGPIIAVHGWVYILTILPAQTSRGPFQLSALPLVADLIRPTLSKCLATMSITLLSSIVHTSHATLSKARSRPAAPRIRPILWRTTSANRTVSAWEHIALDRVTSCNDPSWASPFCLYNVCVDSKLHRELMQARQDRAAMKPVQRCPNDTWCCYANETATCCRDESVPKFKLAATVGVTPSSSIASSTTANSKLLSSTSATASTSSTSTDPPPSAGLGAGAKAGQALR
ncbi:hypothetical protein CC86DRAFT_386604 [Ophiobolus disseminans]|uniref:Uncharacterized protein n=1 Tax=Ophiobolus disseminans TaxID=1469910 RepID=A0A6A6ZJX6_9PLEO|nr:hypothetical protein CC86DRAFT_386604 [Ophiobolus disseminans]